ADTNEIHDVFLKDLQTGDLTRISTNSTGDQATGVPGWSAGSDAPRISADGRYVAFLSDATNLVSGDTNRAQDVFLKDVQTGAVIRVSESSAGTQATSTSFAPTLSADGRYVAFSSS